jgi:hypothetical protein
MRKIMLLKHLVEFHGTRRGAQCHGGGKPF